MKTKRFLSILLSLVLVLGMLPGMSLTASAADSTTENTPSNTSETMTITLIIKGDPAATDFDVTLPTSLAYDGTAKTASATAKSTVTGMGTITVEYYKDGTKVDSAVEIGDYTVKLKVAAGTHYNAGTVENADWKFTITKGTATITKAPEAKTLTYNGSAQELVTAGEADGGEMQYALGTATEATQPYTTSIPAATDAGTYYIWYKAVGDDSHSDSEPACIAVTIAEAEKETVSAPTFSPEAGTYTKVQSVTISCATEGAVIHYTTDGTTPTAESEIYESAISVSETTTIKATAVKEGMTDSEVASATYTISEESEPEPEPEPEPEETTRVEVEELSEGDISDDLKDNGFDSVESIGTALETALSIETEEQKENSKLVDAKLEVSTDGGTTWDPATVANFPAGGIDVVLDYPDGTNGDEYSFSVAHMIGTTANGKTAGEIETPGTTNTEKGIRTHFNGLSPVLITWTKKASPSKKDDSKEEEKEKVHVHHFVWETTEATEEIDGELRYACDICGFAQTRVPITAYYVFNKNTTEKIRNASQGATVKIETSRWISFHKMVLEALAERPDVTLEVSFLDEEYKGNRLTVTIPAGSDTLSLLDENGFAGFLYLAAKYGYTLVN